MDANNHVTTTRYWPDNKVWKVIDAKGNNAVVNRYYGGGSLKEVEDAKGHITKYGNNGDSLQLWSGQGSDLHISLSGLLSRCDG